MKPPKQKPPSTTTPTTPAAAVWRNRITGYGEVDPKQLLANPKNWRIHPQSQQAALGAVLDQVGWVQVAAIINKRSGLVVDGHLRVSLAIARGELSIPVGYVDLSTEEEDLILASFDSLSAAAVTDADKLTSLLGGLELADPALDCLFADLMETGQKISLQNVEGGEPEASGASAGRVPVHHAAIKPVLYAEEVAIFETAIRSTGEPNRGKALMKVCQYYLDHETPERQLDF